jgi:soluble lytic murein transglycosylase-like protein
MLATLRRARALPLVGALGLVVSLAIPAQADTSDAQARAKTILVKVQRLQAEVKKAEQAYDQSLAGVAASVNAAIQTGRTSDQIAAAAATAQDQLDNRIRGLYMSGGPLAIYATLLDSGDIADFQNRIVFANAVVNSDRSIATADQTVAAQAARQAASAGRQITKQIQTERSVQGAATRVLALLQQQQTLLAQAQATVARLQALDAARAAFAAQTAAFNSITSTRIADLRVLPPSPLYMTLYHQGASTCPGLSWTVLAAIGQVESGHGSNPSTSSAGAMGPMQFLPSTFDHYAVDGDHDGVANIMDPADAIYTAAAYLCANGAGGGGDALYSAIWHYNHADWYVQMVLSLAQQYAAQFV